MVFIAAGIYAVRLRRPHPAGLERVLQVVFVIACIATVSMAVHLFAALGADSLADGEHSVVSRVQTVNETVVNASWAGDGHPCRRRHASRSRTDRFICSGSSADLRSRLVSATIAYTDRFDPLFKMGSLLSLWAILVGTIDIWRLRSVDVAAS